jgi:hypothetical protein
MSRFPVVEEPDSPMANWQVANIPSAGLPAFGGGPGSMARFDFAPSARAALSGVFGGDIGLEAELDRQRALASARRQRGRDQDAAVGIVREADLPLNPVEAVGFGGRDRVVMSHAPALFDDPAAGGPPNIVPVSQDVFVARPNAGLRSRYGSFRRFDAECERPCVGLPNSS